MSGSRCTATSMNAIGTATMASQPRAASSQAEVALTVRTASTAAVSNSTTRSGGPMRLRQNRQRLPAGRYTRAGRPVPRMRRPQAGQLRWRGSPRGVP
jgi:hypothetical protein